MTPVCICVREIDAALEIADTAMVSKVETAIDVLEASYPTPTERIFALERVLKTVVHQRRTSAQAPFCRYIVSHIDMRQHRLMMRR